MWDSQLHQAHTSLELYLYLPPTRRGGAGAILGAARTIAQLQPAGVEVHFITAACENMVSGRATKPSDIHTAASGKTVEVNDTDAEGRLTLADALWYAQAHAGAKVGRVGGREPTVPIVHTSTGGWMGVARVKLCHPGATRSTSRQRP